MAAKTNNFALAVNSGETITVTTPTKPERFLAIARKKGVVSDNTVLSLKRGDSTTVDPMELFMEEGFNVRNICQKHIDCFKKDIVKGNFPPAIEVKLVEVIDNETGKTTTRLKVIDGHHRTSAYQQLIEEGELKPETRIVIQEFRGDERDELIKMVVSSQGRTLTISERIGAYVRMSKQGMSGNEIAEAVHANPTVVSQYLMFASAPVELKEIMDSGKIGFSVVNNYRMQYDNFIQVLAAVKEHIRDKEERKVARQKAKETGENSQVAGANPLKKISMKKSDQKVSNNLLTTLESKLKEQGVKTGSDKEVTLTLTAFEVEQLLSQAQMIRSIEEHNENVKLELTKRELAVQNATDESVAA